MELNRHNMQKIALLILFTVLILVGLQEIDSVIALLAYVLHLIMPLILGGAIAFIVNVPMRWLENKLFPPKMKEKRPKLYKLHRIASLVLTFILVVGVIIVLGVLVVPELARSFSTMSARFHIFWDKVTVLLEELAIAYPAAVDEVMQFIESWETVDWQEIGRSALAFLQNGNFLGGTVSIASSIIGGVANFFLGLVFAIYMLLQKEKLGSQFKKVMYSFFPEQKIDRMLEICQLASDTFSSFISGQCVEACILGMLFFVVMSILRLPYAMAISMLIGVTALIPIFGAFIGCAVGAFLILIVDPMKALIFIVVFLILQQVEGNLIYPHVVGTSVGLPSIWVLLAVTLGASTLGVVGMIINIPLFSIIYALLRQSVGSRLKQRHIAPEKLK